MDGSNWTAIIVSVISTGGIGYGVLKYWTDKQKTDYEGKLNFAKQDFEARLSLTKQEADFQIKRQEQLFQQMLIGLKEAQDECQRLRQMVYSGPEKKKPSN